jgi:hypothetical protein
MRRTSIREAHWASLDSKLAKSVTADSPIAYKHSGGAVTGENLAGNVDCMSGQNDRNYVSVGGWMLILLVAALPIIGWLMVLIWAFSGENDTRKNYFRAILAWIVVVTAAVIVLASMGRMQQIEKKLQSWTHRA